MSAIRVLIPEEGRHMKAIHESEWPDDPASASVSARDAEIASLRKQVEELTAQMVAACVARDCAGIFPATPAEAINILTEERNAAEAALAEAVRVLFLIAHTFTEDSHGNMKTMPADYYQEAARTFLSHHGGQHD